MMNSLKESITGYWPRIYFSQYRAVVTGCQLTANRICAAGELHCWHQLAGVVLIQLGGVVCSCTRGRRSGLLKQIRFGVRHCAYNILHMVNISNGDKGASIIQAFLQGCRSRSRSEPGFLAGAGAEIFTRLRLVQILLKFLQINHLKIFSLL